MKGFGIEIKNNLLDPKHVEQMGIAVWLYMWLIDKITFIDEKQNGIVWGGKPVKYQDVKDELGISSDSYTRWVDKLLEYPYIEATRTPYGIKFKVLKAKKRFRKNAERYRRSAESVRKNAESIYKVLDSNNKTYTKTDWEKILKQNPKLRPAYNKLMAKLKV